MRVIDDFRPPTLFSDRIVRERNMEIDDSNSKVTESFHDLAQLETRFLYPFFIREHVANEASDALRAAAIAGHLGAWQVGDAPGLYQDEMLEPVIQYLFSDTAVGPNCIYHSIPNSLGINGFTMRSSSFHPNCRSLCVWCAAWESNCTYRTNV